MTYKRLLEILLVYSYMYLHYYIRFIKEIIMEYSEIIYANSTTGMGKT